MIPAQLRGGVYVGSNAWDPSPIFVVGFPRSGTTLLAAILDRHSTVAIPPETSFFLDVFQNELKTATRTQVLPMGGVISEALATMELEPEELWREYLNDGDGRDEQFLRYMLEEYAKRRGKVRCGEKSPWHLLAVARMLELWPNARILCIVRDGRDAVRSLKLTHFGGHLPMYFHCFEWARCARICLALESRYSHFKWVRYEDLVMAPERVAREVCDFLSLQWEAGQLDPRSPTGVTAPGQTWIEKARQGIDSERAYAWRRATQSSGIRRMELLMQRELVALGYDLSESTSVGPVRWAADRAYISAQLLRYYWRRCVRRILAPFSSGFAGK